MFKKQTLSELISFISRGVTPKYCDEGVTILNQRCIRNNIINFENARQTSLEKTRILQDKYVQKWDVLVNSTGVGTLGRLSQMKKNFKGITVDSHVTIVRPNPELVYPPFFGYALILIEQLIQTLGEGATGQTELSRNRLKELEIYYPPPSTQQRIATILTTYDDLIENNQRRIKILEEMAQNLYREWFVHFRYPGYEDVSLTHSPLGPIPDEWEVKTLGEITSLISRGISPKYDEDSSGIVLNQKCIRNHKISFDPSRSHKTKVPEHKYVQYGDILINSTGVGTLGRVAQFNIPTPENITVDSHVTIVRATTEVDLAFFGQAILSLESIISGLGAGATGQTELNKGRLEELKIIFPSDCIQKHFSEIISPINEAIQVYIRLISTLSETRDLLLPKLISGEIEISDALIPEEDAA